MFFSKKESKIVLTSLVLDQGLKHLHLQVRVHVSGVLQQGMRLLKRRLEQLDRLRLPCGHVRERSGEDAVGALGVDSAQALLPVLHFLGRGALCVAEAVEGLFDPLEVGDDRLDAGVDVGRVVEGGCEEVCF